MKSFGSHYESFNLVLHETHPLSSHSRRQHLAQPLPLPIHISSEFRQISCYVHWDDQALCNHFHRGLRSDVSTLFLNFPEPTSLSQVISLAIQCDNCLFELRQDEQGTRGSHASSRNTSITRTYISVLSPTPTLSSPSDTHTTTKVDSHTPMEIDHTRIQALTKA